MEKRFGYYRRLLLSRKSGEIYGFSHETNQSMTARRESPLTECPVSFCTRNTNFSFAPALAYASEALLAASITPGRGVSESESPLITIKGRGAISGSMAGPSNSE